MEIRAEVASRYSVAAQQNQIPLITQLQLTNVHEETFENLTVRVRFDPPLIEQNDWIISEVRPKQSIDLPGSSLRLPASTLLDLSERVVLDVVFEVFHNENILAEYTGKTELLPYNHWGGESTMPELLAAYIFPNSPVVENTIKLAGELLKSKGHESRLDGYQSNTRERPYLVASAIWSIICDKELTYTVHPASFASMGQKIRPPEQIEQSGLATCLDSALLFAACLEQSGLNPIVALTKSHAIVGAWLIDDTFATLTNDDPIDIRKRVATHDILIIETTLITSDTPHTFEQAQTFASDCISEPNESDFVYALDVRQARTRDISPIMRERIEPTDRPSPEKKHNKTDLSQAPLLPPVNSLEETTEITPDTRVEQWRHKLLDLSKRNRLINISKRTVSLPIYCPNLELLEDQLAAGKSFRFITPSQTPFASQERDPELYRFSTGNDLEREFARKQLDKRTLLVNLAEKDLIRNSITLLRKSKADFEEGGANTLYISIGLLRWRERRGKRSYKAPLILIPVTLTRPKAKSKIKISQIPDEDPIFNLTLIQLLLQDFGIDLTEFQSTLPTDKSGIDVGLVWRKVREKIKDEPGFEVIEDLVVSTFSFAKFLMWRDLTHRIEDLNSSIFVEHLINRPKESYPHSANFIKPTEVDRLIPSKDLFIPLSADSSQIVAIHTSEKGKDFVLEGPPGTGKSETIANIIAHNIGVGRKVLFVAEKMAALNVVYSRLKRIGLEHLCLELHSKKANKRDFLEQLDRATKFHLDPRGNEHLTIANNLDTQRDKLNTVVTELHKESQYGISLRSAIAKSVRNQEKVAISLDWGDSLSDAPIQNPQDLEKMLEEVQAFGLSFADLSQEDFEHLDYLKITDWSFSWQDKFIKTSSKLHSLLAKFSETLISFKDALKLDAKTDKLDEISQWVNLAKMVVEYANNPFPQAIDKNSEQFLSDLKSLTKLKKELNSLLSQNETSCDASSIQNWPVAEWKKSHSESLNSWAPKKMFYNYFLMKHLKNHGLKRPVLNRLPDYERMSALSGNIHSLLASEHIQTARNKRGMAVREVDSMEGDAIALRQKIYKRVSVFPDPSALVMSIQKILVDDKNPLNASPTLRYAQELINQYSPLKTCIEEFCTESGSELAHEDTFDSVQKKLSTVPGQKSRFAPWCKWQHEKEKVSKYQIDSLIHAIETRSIDIQDARDSLYTIFCTWLAKRLMDESENKLNFSSSEQQNNIEQFRELGTELANITGTTISNNFSRTVPNINDRTAPKEFGVLATERQKKKRHKPIRKMITEMGGSLLKLTPCFMMSPLSVAQYLPKEFTRFDLVIFDEASQITVWDAVGSIARGKNVIVVGDPKQMPPTNFFNRLDGDSDNEDVMDLESILDQALAARVPHHRLTGHYRSRHESLIRFSNVSYYENSLITYPSNHTKESAVIWHKVDGLYGKGTNTTNPKEAKMLVEFIVGRLKDPSLCDLSIGVVTMNTAQQRLIEDLLDEKRRNYPEIERFFGDATEEPVFVKNLETVQGNQRDIICISVGYGPKEPGAKNMSMSFGPLNRLGGERRLNVAVTRAASEVHLFTSFDASMIDLSRTKSVGVRDLKTYIDFAARGNIAIATAETRFYGADAFDSDFEESVALKLRDRGWEVRSQIGISNFRVDLGIVHPEFPGSFLAGIECDGATYHSSPSACDRDRVRHIVLENLGWKLLRIWSTDFFRDQDGVIERVCKQLDTLLEDSTKAAKNEVPEEPEDASVEPAE